MPAGKRGSCLMRWGTSRLKADATQRLHRSAQRSTRPSSSLGTMKPEPAVAGHADLPALEYGPVYSFADWPNLAVPVVAAGAYTIWRGKQLIYVGMAGRSMTEAMIAARREEEPTAKIGLASRLASHASGRRSGDQFCVYVGDRLVLPTLAPDDLAAIATGERSFDSLIRSFIRENLSYRFIETPSGEVAYLVERQVQHGELDCGKPFLNPR